MSCSHLYELKFFLQQRSEPKGTIYLFVNFINKICLFDYLNMCLLLILIVFNLFH